MDRAHGPATCRSFMATIICWKIYCGWRITISRALGAFSARQRCLTYREGTIMSTPMKQSNEQLIFRKTNAQKGRTISVTPENSAMKYLVYGRIILDQEVPRASFSTGELESGLICLSGACTIKCDEVTNKIEQYDSIYLPRDSKVEITTDTACDLVECAAEV